MHRGKRRAEARSESIMFPVTGDPKPVVSGCLGNGKVAVLRGAEVEVARHSEFFDPMRGAFIETAFTPDQVENAIVAEEIQLQKVSCEFLKL